MALERGPRLVQIAPGVRLSCHVRGPELETAGRSPLLLLPSVGGGSEFWAELGARLAREFVTVSLDPRGFGRSSPEPAWPSTRGMAVDAALVLDQLGVERAHVFGISLGALVATWLAIDQPRRVQKLALASAAARGLDFSPRHLAHVLRLTRSAVLAEAPKEELAEDVLADAAPVALKARAQAIASVHPWSRRRLLRFLTAVLRHSARSQLAQVRSQVLLLWGECDPIIGPAARRRLCRRLPDAQSSLIPRVGHDLVLEAPRETAESLQHFLLETQ